MNFKVFKLSLDLVVGSFFGDDLVSFEFLIRAFLKHLDNLLNKFKAKKIDIITKKHIWSTSIFCSLYFSKREIQNYDFILMMNLLLLYV